MIAYTESRPPSWRWSRRRVLASAAVPAVAALAACESPRGVTTKKLTVTVAMPAGLPLYEEVASAVEQAVGPANNAAGADFVIQTERFNVPERSTGGITPFVQAVAPLLGREQPIDLILVVSRFGDALWPAGDVHDVLSLRFITSLDKYVKSDKSYKPDDFYPAALNAVRHKGENYARPLTLEPLVLYYDPDLFSASGVRPPDTSWNWQVMRESARRLTKEGSDGQIDQWGLYASGFYHPLLLIWQNGADLVTKDGKASAIADAAAVEALQFFYDLAIVHRVMPPPPFPGRQYEYPLRFQDGRIYAGARARVAMGVAPGTVDLKRLFTQQGIAEQPPKLLMAEVPQGKQRATGLRVVSALAMTTKAASKEAAYRALSALEREASKNLPLSARKTTPDQLRKLEHSLSAESASVLINSLGYARIVPVDNMLMSRQVGFSVWQWAVLGMFARNEPAAEAAQKAARQLDDYLSR